MKKIALALGIVLLGVIVWMGCEKKMTEEDANKLAKENLHTLLANINKEDTKEVKSKIRHYDSELTDDKKLNKFVAQWKKYDYLNNVSFVPLSTVDLTKKGQKKYGYSNGKTVYLIAKPIKGKEKEKNLRKIFVMERPTEEFYLEEVENYYDEDIYKYLKKDKLEKYNMKEVKKPESMAAAEKKANDFADFLFRDYSDKVGTKKVEMIRITPDGFIMLTDKTQISVNYTTYEMQSFIYDEYKDETIDINKDAQEASAIKRIEFSKRDYDYKDIDSRTPERVLAETMNNLFVEQSELIGIKMVSFERNDDYSFSVQTNKRLLEVSFYEDGGWVVNDYKTKKKIVDSNAKSKESASSAASRDKKVKKIVNKLMKETANQTYIGTRIKSVEKTQSTVYYVETDTSELQVDVLRDGWNVYDWNTGAKYFSSNGKDVRETNDSPNATNEPSNNDEYNDGLETLAQEILSEKMVEHPEVLGTKVKVFERRDKLVFYVVTDEKELSLQLKESDEKENTMDWSIAEFGSPNDLYHSKGWISF